MMLCMPVSVQYLNETVRLSEWRREWSGTDWASRRKDLIDSWSWWRNAFPALLYYSLAFKKNAYYWVYYFSQSRWEVRLPVQGSFNSPSSCFSCDIELKNSNQSVFFFFVACSLFSFSSDYFYMYCSLILSFFRSSFRSFDSSFVLLLVVSLSFCKLSFFAVSVIT